MLDIDLSNETRNNEAMLSNVSCEKKTSYGHLMDGRTSDGDDSATTQLIYILGKLGFQFRLNLGWQFL
jgi:hypothetical protein